MTKLKNVHSGEVLSDEFLIPNNTTAYKLAKDIGVSQKSISEIVKCTIVYSTIRMEATSERKMMME